MMETGETNDALPPTNAPTASVNIRNPPAQPVTVAATKQKAAEEKARRETYLLWWLIENTTWQNADHFMVEDSVLKQIIGFDPAVFSVDMM